MVRVAIAGSGWYGCHIGMVLKDQCTQIRIFEKNDDIFTEASGNNQFRLHQGLHYPRSSITRYQSRDGFFRFSERYPSFSREIKNNYYLVPYQESLIDFDTYFSIMLSSGLKIDKINPTEIPYLNTEMFEGAIKCFERGILTSQARTFFKKQLYNVISFSQSVERVEQMEAEVLVNGEKFDYFIDATWGSLAIFQNSSIFYESTLLLYYENVGPAEFSALTLVDGPLWSIYPTELPRVYTVSSVPFSPICTYANKQDAYRHISALGNVEIQERRDFIESHVKLYFPDFGDHFKYKGPQLAIKTKPKGKADNRAASVTRHGRCFQVQSGKIDNIFQASDFILGAIMDDLL